MGAGVEYLSNQPGNDNLTTQHRHLVLVNRRGPACGTAFFLCFSQNISYSHTSVFNIPAI